MESAPICSDDIAWHLFATYQRFVALELHTKKWVCIQLFLNYSGNYEIHHQVLLSALSAIYCSDGNFSRKIRLLDSLVQIAIISKRNSFKIRRGEHLRSGVSAPSAWRPDARDARTREKA